MSFGDDYLADLLDIDYPYHDVEADGRAYVKGRTPDGNERRVHMSERGDIILELETDNGIVRVRIDAEDNTVTVIEGITLEWGLQVSKSTVDLLAYHMGNGGAHEDYAP